MSVNELWSAIKDLLANDSKIDQEVYNTYISSGKLIENKPNDYSLVIKSQFGTRMVEPLLQKIIETIKQITNQYVLLNIITADHHKKQNKVLKDIKNDDYEFGFDHFIVGESNQQSYNAALSVANNPGKWNPLFIYGDSGLGKTHLLKAINDTFKKNRPELKAYYITSDDFGRKVVDVIREGHEVIENFKNEVMDNDVLLIDDIQFLAKKDKTNEILFTVFNHFIENGKQLVFSSDKIPDELNGFDVRLITRFNLGLTTSIKTLDFDTALSIVNNEIQNQQIKNVFEPDAKDYIAKFFANDVRKIKGSITKINFWITTSNNQKPIDMNVISDLFKDVPTSNLGILNVKKIKEVVSEKYGVSIKLIDGKARTSLISNARHMAMFLTRDILNHSLTQIGAEFGGKDHTSVMNAISKIQNNINTNKEFKKQYESLKTKILSK